MDKQYPRFLFPEGKPKSLTFSYDDGYKADMHLIDILNRNGLKGTFHLNSANFDSGTRMESADIKTAYAGHEVSCHTATHPFLERLAPTEAMREVWNDRARLEELTGYTVCGMSYPFGTYNDQVIDILKNAGILYCRTTRATRNFSLPNNYLEWHPTCHHNAMLELGPQYLEYKYAYTCFYVWGHATEFDRNDNWQDMESFAAMMANKPDIWYATNIEIYRYDQAVKNTVVSTDGHIVFNPSALTVWGTVNDQIFSVAPGETKHI